MSVVIVVVVDVLVAIGIARNQSSFMPDFTFRRTGMYVIPAHQQGQVFRRQRNQNFGSARRSWSTRHSQDTSTHSLTGIRACSVSTAGKMERPQKAHHKSSSGAKAAKKDAANGVDRSEAKGYNPKVSLV